MKSLNIKDEALWVPNVMDTADPIHLRALKNIMRQEIKKREKRYGILPICKDCKYPCKQPNLPGLDFECHITGREYHVGL